MIWEWKNEGFDCVYWMPEDMTSNELKFSHLPFTVGENFWFTLRKSTVNQKY